MKIMDAEDRRNRKTSEMSAQERWNLIVEANRQAAEETLGKKENRAENNIQCNRGTAIQRTERYIQ